MRLSLTSLMLEKIKIFILIQINMLADMSRLIYLENSVLPSNTDWFEMIFFPIHVAHFTHFPQNASHAPRHSQNKRKAKSESQCSSDMFSETAKPGTYSYLQKLYALIPLAFLATLWHEILEPILWMRTQRLGGFQNFLELSQPVNGRAKILGGSVWLRAWASHQYMKWLLNVIPSLSALPPKYLTLCFS